VTMRSIIVGLGAVVLGMVAGCSFAARSPDMYRDDTQKLLDTRNAQLKACYDDALKTDAKMAGTVTVQFVVEPETGKVTKAAIDKTKSTAPDALGQCVIRSVDGLVLQPPDANEGQATFSYEFKPNPIAAAAPAKT